MDLFFVFAKNVMYLFFFCIFGGGCLSNTWSNSFKIGNVDVAPIDISIAAGGQRGCIDGLPEDIALAVLVEGLLSRVAPVARVGAALLAKLTGHGVVNPADTLGHGGIDTRCVVLATSDTPSHDSGLDIRSWVKLALADQRTATISLACVLAISSTSADEGVVKLESLAKPGGSEGGLTLVMANNWQDQ